MKIDTKFISQNIAPRGAKEISVYDSNGDKVGTVPLGRLSSKSLGDKLYSFGLVSDIHLTVDTALDDYQRALTYLTEVEKVDFIHVNGDIGKIGSLSEFQKFKEYNDNYAPNTPVHLACGNHDAQYGTVHNVLMTYTGNPLYHSFTKGDDVFIVFGVANWSSEVFTTEQLQWLYELLEANRNKRCFVFQHIMRTDGCGNAHNKYPRDDLNNTAGQVFLSLMEHYKNVIWVHGHSHTTFNLQNVFSIANYDRLFGCQSVHVPSLSIPKDHNHEIIYEDSEGYVVDVYENGIHLRGRDFVGEKFLPIASYWLDTTPINIQANSYVDPTGTINV